MLHQHPLDLLPRADEWLSENEHFVITVSFGYDNLPPVEVMIKSLAAEYNAQTLFIIILLSVSMLSKHWLSLLQ